MFKAIAKLFSKKDKNDIDPIDEIFDSIYNDAINHSNKKVSDWFNRSINEECQSIIDKGSTPAKLFLKYQFKDNLAVYNTSLAELRVIHDPNMGCLMRVE